MGTAPALPRERPPPLKKRAGFPYQDVGVNRLIGLVGSGALLSVVLSACVYDGDNRCGPHQVLLSADRCGCEEGFVPGTAGCVACGNHEQATNGQCLCVDGYARPEQGAACAPIPETLGVACDTETSPCPDGKYSLCHVTDGTSGYCTSACSDTTVCDGGYRCHDAGADGFCRRPPVGYLDDCDRDADCTGEASFCETIRTHQCLVPCAAGKTAGCFEGEVCCDFAIFRPICVPNDACTSMTGTEVH